MSTGDWIFLIFGLVIAAFGIWRFLPKTLFFFTPGAVTSWFVAGEELPPEMMKHADEHLERLTALGYQLAGVLYEKPPLWSKSLPVLVLTNGRAEDLLCLIVGKRRITYYFQTLFTGGQVIITADGGFQPVDRDGLSQFVVESDDAADILERHRENVKNSISEGNQPIQAYPDDVIGGSTRAYYGFPAVRKGMRTYGGMHSFVLVVCLAPLFFALT